MGSDERVTLKPLFEKKRPRCPFYGFNGLLGDVLLDSEGDQCALITDSCYGPCQMKKDGQQPEWYDCPFNSEENKVKLEEMSERARIFPKEFRPPKEKSWVGIPLTDWVQYVLSGKPIEV